jgi:hypothetical protein
VLISGAVIRRWKAAYFGTLGVEIFRFGKFKLPLVPDVDSVAQFCAAVLCISARLQGRVQLDKDSVHLISLSTATICRHFRQKDGTYLKIACTLTNRLNCLLHCGRLRAALVAYLGTMYLCS